MARLAGDAFGHRHAFLRALVRQHGAAHHIPDGVDIRQIGAAVLVDVDIALFVELQARADRGQPVGIGPATDRDHQPIDLQLLHLAIGVLISDLDLPTGGLDARNPATQPDVQPLAREDLQGLPREISVGHGQEFLLRLEQHDFRTQPPPDAAQFQTDHAGADDAEPLGHLAESQGATGIDHQIAIQRRGAQRHGTRAGSEDDVLRADHFLPIGVPRGKADPAGFEQLALARERRDAIGLEESGDALRQ